VLFLGIITFPTLLLTYDYLYPIGIQLTPTF
jgi:hypothetical protein